ncbi:MAG TPA: hypothetical protein VFJ94_10905 [Intrasporangium sp.]|nr:hypothetical protein [Intrasporangium sp.]HET7399018.1 hypothetical protein [Intrasporangium sp.]
MTDRERIGGLVAFVLVLLLFVLDGVPALVRWRRRERRDRAIA